MTTETGTTPSELRQVAINRLRKKREFIQHLAVYLVVNLALSIIWLFTTPGGFYWPMFPLFIWGVGVVFHAMDVFSSMFSSGSPSEQEIQHEMARLTRR